LFPQEKFFSYAYAKKIMLLYAKKLQLLENFVPQTLYLSFSPGPHWGTSFHRPLLLHAPSSFYPYTGSAQLTPSEKLGEGVLMWLQIKTSPYFHWANYTLNKTFYLEGKKPKIERKT